MPESSPPGQRSRWEETARYAREYSSASSWDGSRSQRIGLGRERSSAGHLAIGRGCPRKSSFFLVAEARPPLLLAAATAGRDRQPRQNRQKRRSYPRPAGHSNRAAGL